MKEVLAHIEKKKREFAKLPLFEYMRDTSIDPRQRLAWVPCLAPLVMSYTDLNRYFLRREPTNDVIQELINRHTYEEDYHWEWFLEDINTLGLNHTQNFNEFLKFVWGEETKKTRLVCQKTALHTFQADSITLIIIIKTLEATWNVALPLTVSVTQELEHITKQNYYFFGKAHFEIENSHSMETGEAEELIKNLELTKDSKDKAFSVINNIFDYFSECVDEMFEYANKHTIPLCSESAQIA